MPSPDADKRNSASRTVTSSLHPRVYTILIGLALWMALWVWSFVGGEADYILFIVTGFIVVVVALQLVLMRVWRADKTIDESNSAKDGAISFQQWGHRISDRRAWADVAGYRPAISGRKIVPGSSSAQSKLQFYSPRRLSINTCMPSSTTSPRWLQSVMARRTMPRSLSFGSTETTVNCGVTVSPTKAGRL